LKTNAIVYALLVVILLASTPAIAEGGNFGLGIILGSPTGITGKYMFTESHALDADLAWDFLYGGFAGTVDYLFHFRNVLNSSTVGMKFYLGPGGMVGTRNVGKGSDKKTRLAVAARGTAGLSFMFTKVPIELFIDGSPGMWLIPYTRFYLSGGLGFRYFF